MSGGMSLWFLPTLPEQLVMLNFFPCAFLKLTCIFMCLIAAIYISFSCEGSVQVFCWFFNWFVSFLDSVFRVLILCACMYVYVFTYSGWIHPLSCMWFANIFPTVYHIFLILLIVSYSEKEFLILKMFSLFFKFFNRSYLRIMSKNSLPISKS